MKTQTQQTIYQAIVFLMLGMFVAACSPSLPVGEIHAEVVANGKALKQYPLALFRLEGDEAPGMDEIREAQIFTGNTDESGKLFAENMPAGYYLLAIPDFESGGFNLVYQGDEIFMFELPEDRGVDLGVVDASITRPMAKPGD